jgi:hypothetical protein
MAGELLDINIGPHERVQPEVDDVVVTDVLVFYELVQRGQLSTTSTGAHRPDRTCTPRSPTSARAVACSGIGLSMISLNPQTPL